MLNKKIEFKGQSSLVILFLIVCVISIVAVFFVVLRDRVPNFREPAPPNPIAPNPIEVPPVLPDSTEIINNFETPPLTEKYNWEQAYAAEDDFDFYIWYDNRYKRNSRTGEGEVQQLEFNGRLNKISLSKLDKTSLFEGYNVFVETYINELKKLGWEENTSYGDYFIMGINADGINAKVRGLVKKEEEYISTVVVAANYESNFSESPEDGIVVNCPCDLTLKVFMGDPLNLDLLSGN